MPSLRSMAGKMIMVPAVLKIRGQSLVTVPNLGLQRVEQGAVIAHHAQRVVEAGISARQTPS